MACEAQRKSNDKRSDALYARLDSLLHHAKSTAALNKLTMPPNRNLDVDECARRTGPDSNIGAPDHSRCCGRINMSP
jgi:hypothetical protein